MKAINTTAVLHDLGDLVLILDVDQRVMAAYGRWIQTRRMSPSKFLGSTIAEAWPADVAALHVAMNARGLDGQIVVYDWEYPVPGSGDPWMTTIFPIFGKNNRVRGVVRVSRQLPSGAKPLATHAVQTALHQLDPLQTRGPARRGSRSKAPRLDSKASRILFRLSARERHVAGLLLDSARSSQIARELKISVHTVRQHVKNILRKAGVHSQQELLDLLRGKPRANR